MSIPLSQLTTWSNQGATVSAKATHESVRNALTHDQSPLKDRISNGSVKIYLQGSYKNDTNIRADSDVDVVVELTTTFGHNAHELPYDQKNAHDQSYGNAAYDWQDLRRDVITGLTKYYGVDKIDTNSKKSIKVLPSPGRLKADIVPVINYRKYDYFYGTSSHSSAEGIKFYHRTTNRGIINYPEHHYQNGVSKNSDLRTGGRFKPTVRIFKNMRKYLIDTGKLTKDVAPSYFLQSLIYNVPDEHFTGDHSATIYAVLKHLWQGLSLDRCVCQNRMHSLFGESEEQWNQDDAVKTIRAFVELWDNWN
ncbi:MAG: nucleotidyltransferase [Bacteroidota bacterium]